MESQHICSRCGEPIQPSPYNFTTGYGLDGDGNKVCYTCCAKEDRDFMTKHGKITLYLTVAKNEYGVSRGKVGNWPDSLKWENLHVRKGKHNWGIPRYDVWFIGPDENGKDCARWHGVQYGDNTQLCHCKRTKQRI